MKRILGLIALATAAAVLAACLPLSSTNPDPEGTLNSDPNSFVTWQSDSGNLRWTYPAYWDEIEDWSAKVRPGTKFISAWAVYADGTHQPTNGAVMVYTHGFELYPSAQDAANDLVSFRNNGRELQVKGERDVEGPGGAVGYLITATDTAQYGTGDAFTILVITGPDAYYEFTLRVYGGIDDVIETAFELAAQGAVLGDSAPLPGASATS